MKPFFLWMLLFFLLLFPPLTISAETPISDATSECLDCHASLHPGIVAEWKKSRHAQVTPGAAASVQGLSRKVSSESVPDALKTTSVGCAECHGLRSDAHKDSFEHNGHTIHVVVSPQDCRTCHSVEAEQYSKNLMSHAYANLAENALYQKLELSILGQPTFIKDRIRHERPDAVTREEACYYCHGTRLSLEGTEKRTTDLAGELEFPIIRGWPNQGVGRINLDGSKGACSACHTRHLFSIATARKPYTCKECHVGPDVPAFKVYEASKHGSLFSSHGSSWEFTNVPWTIGKDFTAPTCAACHVSLLVNQDGTVVSERSHQMSDRLPWRLFGLIYAHPHPKGPDTTSIRNKEGLPLPTDLNGEFASAHLIDEKERLHRTETMQAACLNCHDRSWVNGFWNRLENTVSKTNSDTRVATQLMEKIWETGLADGKENPFDEAIEKKWSDTWLFYANTIRFASAMGGGGDYAVFADGRYMMAKSLAELADWWAFRRHPILVAPQK